jgi:hypothetical protein
MVALLVAGDEPSIWLFDASGWSPYRTLPLACLVAGANLTMDTDGDYTHRLTVQWCGATLFQCTLASHDVVLISFASLHSEVNLNAADSFGFNMVRWDSTCKHFAVASEGGCAVVFSAPKEEEIDDATYVSVKRMTTSAQTNSTQDDAMEVVTTTNDNGKRAREGETKDENDATVQESDAKRKKVQQRNVEVTCEYRFWNADTKHRSESADEQEEVDLGTGTTCPACCARGSLQIGYGLRANNGDGGEEEEQEVRKVRTVEFASDDVLVFSEGIKYIHVVDLRNHVRQGLDLSAALGVNARSSLTRDGRRMNSHRTTEHGPGRCRGARQHRWRGALR